MSTFCTLVELCAEMWEIDEEDVWITISLNGREKWRGEVFNVTNIRNNFRVDNMHTPQSAYDNLFLLVQGEWDNYLEYVVNPDGVELDFNDEHPS
jgi:hypothetical protein